MKIELKKLNEKDFLLYAQDTLNDLIRARIILTTKGTRQLDKDTSYELFNIYSKRTQKAFARMQRAFEKAYAKKKSDKAVHRKFIINEAYTLRNEQVCTAGYGGIAISPYDYKKDGVKKGYYKYITTQQKIAQKVEQVNENAFIVTHILHDKVNLDKESVAGKVLKETPHLPMLDLSYGKTTKKDFNFYYLWHNDMMKEYMNQYTPEVIDSLISQLKEKSKRYTRYANNHYQNNVRKYFNETTTYKEKNELDKTLTESKKVLEKYSDLDEDIELTLSKANFQK